MNRVSLSEVLKRKLIFVMGKGGVGKTTLSQAFALKRAQQGVKTLWVGFEDPLRPLGETQKINDHLDHLNCDAQVAFEEYAILKIKVPGLAKLFVRNSLMKYLSKATPGVKDVLMLGKVWAELRTYQVVVVDMPSTGYGIAMFNGVQNYSRLFKGSPVQKDADRMLTTFRDTTQTGTVIVTLPEEMPITEALELEEHMNRIFENPLVSYVVNKRFPAAPSSLDSDPAKWPSPVPTSALDYVERRAIVETDNLRQLTSAGIPLAQYEWQIDEGSLIESLAAATGAQP